MLSFPQASSRREGAFTFEMQQMFKEYLGGCRMQPYAAQVSWVQNTFASQLNAPRAKFVANLVVAGSTVEPAVPIWGKSRSGLPKTQRHDVEVVSNIDREAL